VAVLEFLFNIETIKGRLEAQAKLVKECNSTGHVSSGHGSIISSHREIKVYDTCERCNLLYERKPTPKELEDYKKLMKTAFTV
jgi:hypothetical protein